MAYEHDAGPPSALEASFHCGQRGTLIARDDLRLRIAGRKCHEHRRHETGQRAVAKIETRLLEMDATQRVERADRGHRKRAGDERRCLIVRKLNQRPLVEQVGTHVGEDERPVE